MSERTFVIGDIHGDLEALFKLLSCFPPLEPSDTIVFLGDYLDRGPKSAEVVDYLRHLPDQVPAKVVALRGNHEDAWIRVASGGWPEFTSPPGNGVLATLRSYRGQAPPREGEQPNPEEQQALSLGTCLPDDVVAWLASLPFYHEDEHAIYVHAGLVRADDGYLHPEATEPKSLLLWCRDEDFFRNYRGKPVVFGHTATVWLPPELSSYTPDDPADLWAGPCTVGLDTGAGVGGFLTGLELPSMRVYESRD